MNRSPWLSRQSFTRWHKLDRLKSRRWRHGDSKGGKAVTQRASV